MSAFENCFEELRHAARLLGRSNIYRDFHLRVIHRLRRVTNIHAVILDDEFCIVVL